MSILCLLYKGISEFDLIKGHNYVVTGAARTEILKADTHLHTPMTTFYVIDSGDSAVTKIRNRRIPGNVIYKSTKLIYVVYKYKNCILGLL